MLKIIWYSKITDDEVFERMKDSPRVLGDCKEKSGILSDV